MITDLLLSALSAVPLMLLSLLPSVDITIPNGVFDWLISTCNTVAYILPIKALMPIFILMLSINAFKIAWALVLRVKSFIPMMGS